MKLREIELLGFKSFADRTRVACDGGIAAIVGPNGCGKSNLADAVSWVLGEQSARLLRGERMSDVIFNGAGGRPPTGMAEVGITLTETGDDGAGRAGPAGASGPPRADTAGGEAQGVNGGKERLRLPDEIKVTRRLFRSGESEYLLNGEICRLRDIQDLFMGTGLGPESYAIIEQGRVGQILSSKPSDRRAIIEDAAGTSKFKSRKRLAEAKLESSRQNLARIHDILEEISKQVNSLKRQASRAERYRELQQEMRSRQRGVFASRLIALERESGRLQQNLSAAQEECAEAAQALETLDRERALEGQRCERLAEESKPLREQCLASEIEAERLRSRFTIAGQQHDSLEARCGEAGRELARIEDQAQRLEDQSKQRAEGAQQLRVECLAAKESASHWAQRRGAVATSLAAKEGEAESGRRNAVSTAARAAELRNQIVKAEEMTASLERQYNRLRLEQENAEAAFRRLSTELDAAEAENQRSEADLNRLSEVAVRSEEALERERAEEGATRQAVEMLEREISQASARRQALEESLARHAYSTESVRRLLSAPKDASFRPLGLLADFLEVTPGYEDIVEEFLKSELDCVVVEGHGEARDGMALLQNEGAGRSAFFIRNYSPNGDNGHENGLHDAGNREARGKPGVMACLAELVHFDSRLNLNGTPGLPMLCNSFVVEDATAAEGLAAAYPGCHFLTLKGEHYHHRLLSGGKGASAGPLALRRDFRDLERRLAELRPALAQAEDNWAGARSRLASVQEETRRVVADKLEVEKQTVVMGERLRQARDVVRQAADRARVLSQESTPLAAERDEVGRDLEGLRVAIGSACAEEQQSQRQAAEATDASRELRAELDSVSQNLAAEQVAAGALEERWRAADAERSRVAAEALESRERLGQLTMQIRESQEEQGRLKEEAEATRQILAKTELRRQELSVQCRTHEEESQLSRARRDELQPQVVAARAALDSCREKKSEVEVILARAESDLDHHARQCQEELGGDRESLRAEAAGGELLEGERLQTAEQELRALKDRIERLGPVNMMALEELREAEERLNFLETQRQDLLASINDTVQAIREIDEASRRKFLDAFEAINGFFAETFRTLFGGGAGGMRLSDEADPESGVDLAVQPPGKRLQNVLLLSGGEKALTALALLIAVFRFAPSPFCILDEVDAPLDESNVVRFTRLIGQMSEKTQFILITHNKRTMEVCRMMYGITMEEPGVSKLVSVRFEASEPERVAIPA